MNKHHEDGVPVSLLAVADSLKSLQKDERLGGDVDELTHSGYTSSLI